MKTIFNKIIFFNKRQFFYIFMFIAIVSSINVSPYEILKLNSFIFNINYLNGLRILFFIISSLLIILIFIIRLKKFVWNNFKNRILIILLLSFFIQIVSIFINYEISFIINESKMVHGIFLNYSAIVLCLFFSLINDEKIFLQIVCVFILFLAVFYIPLSLVILFDWFSNNLSAVYFSDIIRHGTLFLETPMPRSTGIARILLIFFIISLIIQSKYPKSRIYNFFIFLFSFIIICIQSKFSLIMIPIILLLFEILKGFKLKKLIKGLILYFIFPYILFNTIIFGKFYLKTEYQFFSDKKIILEKINNGNRFLNNSNNQQYKSKLESVSSGRLVIWKEAINFFDPKNILTGFGAHSDRLLLNQGKYKNFGNNISNIYLYSIFSGGIFSLILIIIFNISIMREIYKNLYLNEIGYILSSLILITFFIRGLLEITYGFFGVDLIVVLLAFQYFFYKSKLKK